MTSFEPAKEDSEPLIYTTVELPPAHEIDNGWCADFSTTYGRRGFRFGARTKFVFAQDEPPEHTAAGSATSYSSFFLPEAGNDGDLIDGEVVGARIVPSYPIDMETGEPVIDNPELTPHIVLANAHNLTHYEQMSRSPWDLISVPFDPDLNELILYS